MVLNNIFWAIIDSPIKVDSQLHFDQVTELIIILILSHSVQFTGTFNLVSQPTIIPTQIFLFMTFLTVLNIVAHLHC